MMKKMTRNLFCDKCLNPYLNNCKLKLLFTYILVWISSFSLHSQIHVLGGAKVISLEDSIQQPSQSKIEVDTIKFSVKKEPKAILEISKPKKSSIRIKYKAKLVLKYQNSTDNSFSIANKYEKIAISNSFQKNQKAINVIVGISKKIPLELKPKKIHINVSSFGYDIQSSSFLSRPPPTVIRS